MYNIWVHFRPLPGSNSEFSSSTTLLTGFACPRKQKKKHPFPAFCPLFNDVLGFQIGGQRGYIRLAF
jgi:hypothetical protein